MEEIKKLQEIQNEIKKELGGSSLNHLLKYFFNIEKNKKNITVFVDTFICIQEVKADIWMIDNQGIIFNQYYKLLNKENQALNVFGQTEEFQRKFYEIIIMLKNTENL